MLEELGIPYELHWVNIGQGDQFDPAFLKISPNNKMPAIVDPEGPGADGSYGGDEFSVFESGAILQYLGRKFGKFYPRDERAKTRVDEWLMWQMGGLGPMAGQAHHFRIYAPEKIDYAIKRYTEECARLYGVMSRQLEQRDFLAGEYSIADIACMGWITAHERQGQDLKDYPGLRDWFHRMLARPAVRKGLSIGLDKRLAAGKKEDQQLDRMLKDAGGYG